jgi:hypothetical protein
MTTKKKSAEEPLAVAKVIEIKKPTTRVRDDGWTVRETTLAYDLHAKYTTMTPGEDGGPPRFRTNWIKIASEMAKHDYKRVPSAVRHQIFRVYGNQKEIAARGKA